MVDLTTSTKQKKHLASIKSATDYLAVDRTILANERTFLSYIRTAFMFLGTGITFAKFFHEDIFMVRLGIAFSIISIPLFVFAFYRFKTFARHIKNSYLYHHEEQ